MLRDSTHKEGLSGNSLYMEQHMSCPATAGNVDSVGSLKHHTYHMAAHHTVFAMIGIDLLPGDF